MVNEELRRELLAMRSEDMRVRQELMNSGELGGAYVPRMEAVHRRNAARLRELVASFGWPGEDIAGRDGAEAAWFVAQHAIGEPAFQRDALALLRTAASQGRAPAWHAAYLEDRIAMQEGRPQRYGTQWLDDPFDGRIRPWQLADPAHVNDLRENVGLKPLAEIPETGPELSAPERQAMERDRDWWKQWFASKGWRASPPDDSD
jgi:uncharacterized protein DUF6624